MTSEEFVKIRYPKATIERQRSGMIKGMQKTYYLVRKTRFETMYLASGDTKSKAWANAKKAIQRAESAKENNS